MSICRCSFSKFEPASLSASFTLEKIFYLIDFNSSLLRIADASARSEGFLHNN
jgi:hypothetical protein